MEGKELGTGNVRFHNEKPEGEASRNFRKYSEEN